MAKVCEAGVATSTRGGRRKYYAVMSLVLRLTRFVECLAAGCFPVILNDSDSVHGYCFLHFFYSRSSFQSQRMFRSCCSHQLFSNLTNLLTLQKSTVHAWLFSRSEYTDESNKLKSEISVGVFIWNGRLKALRLPLDTNSRSVILSSLQFRYRKHVYELPKCCSFA